MSSFTRKNYMLIYQVSLNFITCKKTNSCEKFFFNFKHKVTQKLKVLVILTQIYTLILIKLKTKLYYFTMQTLSLIFCNFKTCLQI